MENSRKTNMKSLDEAFHTINRYHIKIKKGEKKINDSILLGVLNEFVKIMRTENALFSRMNPRLLLLGSNFDGLRIGKPDEYDYNVILKIPVNYGKINLDATDTDHCYTTVVMPSEFRRLSKIPEMANKGFAETRMWCDTKYRLSVSRFRSWMQSVVDAALNTLPMDQDKRVLIVDNERYEIFSRTSGPAVTLTIITPNGLIDVDLVPTFEFTLPQKPKGSKVDFEKVKSTKRTNYFIVPKPTGCDFSWRLSFPYQEKFYLNNKNNMKSVIRLLKLLRDVQGFKPLASYFIKTLVLSETENVDDSFWSKKSLSHLFIYTLKKLRDCLKVGEIKNFWCDEFNLLKDKIKNATCRNWSNRLSFIIDDICKRGVQNPNMIEQYFSNREEKE